MSNYQLAETSFNIFRLESWERLLKYWGVSILVGIVVGIIMVLVMNTVGKLNMFIALLLVLGLVLTAQAYALSWYEYWRGCNFQIDK